jgi:signal transduction histidine kinase
MPPADLAALVGIALAASLLVALAGVVALVLLRRGSLRIQLGVMVAVAVVAVAASMIAVARWMFISSHDLTVGVTVACVSGVVSLAVCLVLASLVTRNLRQLRLAARELDSGEVTALSGTAATAEFHQLALELRATSERLAESRARERQLETARRQFVAGISHDLRTPLAGIRAMSEALEDGLVDDQDRYLREMRAKVEQLSGLVDDLFQLSKIDAGMLELAVSEVSLYDIVSDAVADLGSSANGRDITVESSRTEDLTVRADPRELARAISNLLLNAVQHTAPGTPITVIAGRSTDGRPSISVIDQGGGIREDDLERVFEPGWRGASARSPLAGGRTAGAGLGLAIVAGIVNAHSGEATVRNIPGGCRFDLVLPA